MEYIDAATLKSKELNQILKEKMVKFPEVTIVNAHAMHNIAIGLANRGRIIVQGSTGFYTGGFLEGATLVVEGNAGWYAGDNMMDGELIVEKNAGCNAGTYFYGGTMVVYGSAGSRLGYGMKGGAIIVCGSAGRWAGQMTLGGKLIILGEVGKQVGESMYKGVIFVRDQDAQSKLGGNVYLDSIQEKESQELLALFTKYHIEADPGSFQAIRPVKTGRHQYVLFKPELTESTRKTKKAVSEVCL